MYNPNPTERRQPLQPQTKKQFTFNPQGNGSRFSTIARTTQPPKTPETTPRPPTPQNEELQLLKTIDSKLDLIISKLGD